MTPTYKPPSFSHFFRIIKFRPEPDLHKKGHQHFIALDQSLLQLELAFAKSQNDLLCGSMERNHDASFTDLDILNTDKVFGVVFYCVCSSPATGLPVLFVGHANGYGTQGLCHWSSTSNANVTISSLSVTQATYHKWMRGSFVWRNHQSTWNHGMVALL